MTVMLEFHYKDREPETIQISNGYHTRMVILGVYTAVGVMCSPDGKFWYSERFEQPSAHGGMRFDKKGDCAKIAASLRTVRHALIEGGSKWRPWVTVGDQDHLRSGTYNRILECLKGAKALTFS